MIFLYLYNYFTGEIEEIKPIPRQVHLRHLLMKQIKKSKIKLKNNNNNSLENYIKNN